MSTSVVDNTARNAEAETESPLQLADKNG